MQSAHNPATEEICEEMAQMRTELGLVLKNFIGVAEKVNAVNYLSKQPPPSDKYYHEEDSYALNEQMGFFYQMPKAPIRIIGSKVREIEVRTMEIITKRVTMFDMAITTTTTT